MRKGQLSIETMIIYGLVILVALSVVGALIYFNVLDLSNYLPNQCNIGGTGDLKCEEMSLQSDGTLQLGIRNTGTRAIESLSVTVTDEEGFFFSDAEDANASVEDDDISSDNPLGPGQMALVTIEDAKGAPGRVMKARLDTTYKLANGVVSQKASGFLRIKSV